MIKTTILNALLTLIFSMVCFNLNAMNNLLKNTNTIVSEKSLNKTEIEIALGIKLNENKDLSTPEIKIFEPDATSIWSDYNKVELRIFANNTRYFLLIYPDEPLVITAEELKKYFSYKDFTPADPRRKELSGYHFEKNSNKISFYYDEPIKRVIMISIEGIFQ